jgi:hypothetical protein
MGSRRRLTLVVLATLLVSDMEVDCSKTVFAKGIRKSLEDSSWKRYMRANNLTMRVVIDAAWEVSGLIECIHDAYPNPRETGGK